jgi:hypothetical protein
MPHRAGASGFVRVTVAAAGCDEACFTEYELDAVTGVPQRTGETAEQPKSLAACGVTLRLAVPGEQSAVEAAARQLCSYMRRYACRTEHACITSFSSNAIECNCVVACMQLQQM